MDSRGVLDTIVQSSVVGLFHDHGVAVAPVRMSRAVPQAAPEFELTGLVQFDGRGLNGALSLALPKEVFPLIRQDVQKMLQARDLVRELSNQLMGRIKNRLLQFQVTLQTGLPQVLDRVQMSLRRQRSTSFAVYSFRTIRGELVVTLEGSIDEAVLNYSGAVNLANEGDIILF